MGILRGTSAPAAGGLVMLLACACSFEPDLGHQGYQVCPAEQTCPGGFACLDDVCAPDCTDLDDLAKVEPGQDDHGLWECSPDAYCEPADDDGGPARLEVLLKPGSFLMLGPEPATSLPSENCSRVIARVSLAAREQDEGRPLTIVLEGEVGGRKVTGVFGDIKLAAVPAGADWQAVDAAFVDGTVFMAIDTDTFGWPVKVKLMPSEEQAQTGGLGFAARYYKMYACLNKNS